MVFLLFKRFVYELIVAKKTEKRNNIEKKGKVIFSKKENIFIQDVTLEANFIRKSKR